MLTLGLDVNRVHRQRRTSFEFVVASALTTRVEAGSIAVFVQGHGDKNMTDIKHLQTEWGANTVTELHKTQSVDGSPVNSRKGCVYVVAQENDMLMSAARTG